eukprot:superscaffoldBa00000612_g6055
MGQDSLSPPVNVTIKAVKANSAVVTWDIPEGDPVIGFAITQQKKDVRMLRFIQEVNTTTRSCALWDLEEETDYIVHVQSISMSGTSPLSEPLRFRTPKEAETQASKSKDEVTMEEVGQTTQLRAGELIIIVVVLIMWAGVIALFCRQYDIIKDNEPNNNKDKAKNSSECSTPEHPTGGLLRSKFPKNNNNRMPSVNIIEAPLGGAYSPLARDLPMKRSCRTPGAGHGLAGAGLRAEPAVERLWRESSGSTVLNNYCTMGQQSQMAPAVDRLQIHQPQGPKPINRARDLVILFLSLSLIPISGWH